MGNYETYLDGVKALYTGDNPRFRNQSDLARYVELEPAQVKKYSQAESTKNLEKICAFLDKIGAQIVFPGEQMDGFVLIPRVKAVAGAGSSFEVDSSVEKMYAFRESFMHFLGIKPKHAVMMFVRGDSMQPLINDRDTILIDTDDKTLREGYIYVLAIGDELMVKRPQKTLNGWNICSENKNYSPIPVEGQALESLEVIGRVRWFGRVL